MEEVDVFGGRIGVIIGDKWNEIQVVCDLENCGTVRQKNRYRRLRIGFQCDHVINIGFPQGL